MNEVKLKTSSLTISPKGLLRENPLNQTNPKYSAIESPTNDNSINYQLKVKSNETNDKSLRNKSHIHINNDLLNDFELILYEKQRKESVVQELDKKRLNLESEFKKCEEEFEEENKLIRQKYAIEISRRINSLRDDYKALEESLLSKDSSFETNSMTVNSNSKLKEIESKHQFLVKEQHKKQSELRRKQLIVYRNECESVVKSCVQLSNQLESDLKNDQYFHTLKQELNSMNGLLQSIDFLINKSDLSDSDINCAQNFKIQINELKDKLFSNINQLKQKTKPIDCKPIAENSKSNISEERKSDSISKFVDTNAFKNYLRLQTFSNDFENSFQSFVKENNFKQKRNELQLFVKTTINTISSESVEHIRDKLNRLTQLFSEKTVEYGGKHIKCNSKDGSLNFCMSLTSKMFIVSQYILNHFFLIIVRFYRVLALNRKISH